jgi:hypothetical protein
MHGQIFHNPVHAASKVYKKWWKFLIAPINVRACAELYFLRNAKTDNTSKEPFRVSFHGQATTAVAFACTDIWNKNIKPSDKFLVSMSPYSALFSEMCVAFFPVKHGEKYVTNIKRNFSYES